MTEYRVIISDEGGKGGASTPVDADDETGALLAACRKRYGAGVVLSAYEHEGWHQAMWMNGDVGPFTMDLQATVEDLRAALVAVKTVAP